MGETQCLKPVAKTKAETEVKIEIMQNQLNSELFSFTHPKMFEARSQDRSRYLSQDWNQAKQTELRTVFFHTS